MEYTCSTHRLVIANILELLMITNNLLQRTCHKFTTTAIEGAMPRVNSNVNYGLWVINKLGSPVVTNVPFSMETWR